MGRNLAKKVVRKFITCFRHNAQTVQPIMGQLPELRLTPGSPFDVTGVDYAGPSLIKNNKGRGAKLYKCYVSLFVCFSRKAVYLELVTELTKDAFLLGLKRFVARRGKPAQIFSDNSKNFVAVASHLKYLDRFLLKNNQYLIDTISLESIDWKFILPHSPHFGGL